MIIAPYSLSFQAQRHGAISYWPPSPCEMRLADLLLEWEKARATWRKPCFSAKYIHPLEP